MKLYLKYVFGRSRLSASLTNFHQISYIASKSGRIPETHTCFFEIDIGDYESDEELRKKLLYGMESCNEIAEETGNF